MKIFHKLLATVVLPLAVTAGRAADVTVFAASSSTDALKEIAATYEPQSGDKIVFNFAGSGTLARQIEAGAPADLFFSADEARADALAQKGLLVSGSRTNLLGNSLVIITPPEQAGVRSAADLTNAACQRVALGDVKSVPCGTYAKVYLDKLGLWTAVEPKVVSFDTVRAVLAAVESGNVDAGFVFKTDAMISKKVKVAVAIAAAAGPEITYPLALVKDAPQAAAANKFAAFLETGTAAAVFKKFGFIVRSAPAGP
jgi:molybdate transport system substrate-binding protein